MKMYSGRDFLFRPVLAGALKAESLVDGTVDLEFILEINDALDVQDENEQRMHDAVKNR